MRETNSLSTHAILISNTPFVGPMRPLRFGNSFIHFATKTTCLGVEIDCKLNWKPQIDQVAKKFSGKLKFIKKMKRLPAKVLEIIYFKGITPCVTHCIAVWGTCPTASFNRLEVLHTKAAKLISYPVKHMILKHYAYQTGNHRVTFTNVGLLQSSSK